MAFVHYLTDDWKATLSSVGGQLLQLQYRRKNFQLLHTPRPLDRKLETPEKWGVSFALNTLDLNACVFELEEYADGFGARYHHAKAPAFDYAFELWIRYQFYPDIVRQSIAVKSFNVKPMPFQWGLYPVFRLPQRSSLDVTIGENGINQSRPSGFAGAIFHHPAKALRIAYMVDPAYSRWELKRDRRCHLFTAGTLNNAVVAPGGSRTLITSIAVGDTAN